MNEPKRLRDDGSAPAALRGLVGSAPLSRPMSKEMRARSAARVDRIAALPAAAGLLLWLKGAAAAVGLGVVSVAVVTVVTRPPAAPVPSTPRARVEVRAPAAPRAAALPPVPPPPIAQPGPSAVPAPALVPAPLASSRAPVVAGATQPSVPDDPLAREATLLEQARAVLDRFPSEALVRLEAHAAAFPQGALAPERELMAVEALRRLGRVAEARRRGEALLATSRGGLYEPRVRATLATLPDR